MRGITLWQPGASAVAYEAKAYETRSWTPPAALVGETIAIHAAKTAPSEKALRDAIVRLARNDTHREWMLEARLISWWHDREIVPHDILVNHPGAAHRGMIVATAVIAEVVDADSVWPGPAEVMVGNFARGRYAWRLEDVRRLHEPVEFTGGQGFFRVDEETQAKIREDHDADRTETVP